MPTSPVGSVKDLCHNVLPFDLRKRATRRFTDDAVPLWPATMMSPALSTAMSYGMSSAPESNEVDHANVPLVFTRATAKFRVPLVDSAATATSPLGAAASTARVGPFQTRDQASAPASLHACIVVP